MSDKEFTLKELAAAKRGIKERDDPIANLRGELATVRMREADRATAEGTRLWKKDQKAIAAIRKLREQVDRGLRVLVEDLDALVDILYYGDVGEDEGMFLLHPSEVRELRQTVKNATDKHAKLVGAVRGLSNLATTVHDDAARAYERAPHVHKYLGERTTANMFGVAVDVILAEHAPAKLALPGVEGSELVEPVEGCPEG